MRDEELTIIELIIMGGLIGIAKVLVEHVRLTFRLIAGRALLGAATSMLAGIVLLQIPDLPTVALLGIGSALGIVGSQYLETLLQKKVKQFFDRR